jgi:tetratricopeptide (TPR) repeat protein
MIRVKRWIRKPWLILLLVAGGGLVILAFPHLVSAHHIEAGGRAMWNPPQAVAHFERAIHWDPKNAQAHRLLAKALTAQGEWLAAIGPLTRYTELRPDNALGRIELAVAYEGLETEMAGMRLADLLAFLPQAQVQTPDAPVDTPYDQPNALPWHSYVAEATFSLTPSYGERPTLFMHSPSQVSYALSLPRRPTVLRFSMGMDPQSHDWPGDGATFEVLVNGERFFLEHLDKLGAHQGWHPRTLDLAPWAGEEIMLTLVVTPGPAADSTGDWAGWGEPQVVDARLEALETVGSNARTVEAWRQTGLTLQDFLNRGEAAREAGQDSEAMAWYERAMWIEPQLSDPWYYVGRLYETDGQWQKALAAYEHALALDRSQQVGRSSSHFRMGVIYQRYLDPPQLEDALAAYQLALAAGDSTSRRDAAWVHARLGQVQYALDGHAAPAESEMLKALELAPGDKWLWVILGDLHLQEGQVGQATAMFQRALEIDPNFEASQRRLDALQE